MRIFATAVCFAIITLLGATEARARDHRLCGDQGRIERILTDCREALAELKGMNAANPNFGTRNRTARQIKLIRRQLKLLRAELAMAPEKEPPRRPKPKKKPAGPVAMDGNAFAALLQAVDQESFPKGKLRPITAAATGHYFTVLQLRTLMRKFSFADSKIKTAVALRPRLVDPANFFQVYQELQFENDKKKLRKLVGK